MGAIRFAPTAVSDAAWDGFQQEQRAGRSQAQLMAAYAYVDSMSDANSKTAYRYLHHEIDATSGSVGSANTRACLAAIATLNDTPVGSGLTASERADVYQHLAKHLVDAGMKPPAFRTLDPEIDLAPTVERRFALVPVELRAGNGDAPVIQGYAAMFEKLSDNLGGFVERVAPSFFNKARADGWPGVLCRYNHKDDFLLGTTRGRTLRLQPDNLGLHYEVDPPKCRADVVEMIGRGDVGQSSFAFRAIEDEWSLTESGYPMRTLISGQILDVAPVARAAYPSTTTALRSLADKMSVDPEELRHMAIKDELRSLWVNTKGTATPFRREKQRLFGPAARAQLDALRDPWGDPI